MPIQILSFNDFHGNLEPPAGSSGRIVDRPRRSTPDRQAGRRHRGRRRRGVPRHPPRAGPRRATANTLTVAAGDIIGASPLLSAAFHDEPTIEAMNKLGLDVTAWATTSSTRATRSSSGWPTAAASTTATARTTRTPAPTTRSAGANFDYLAANVVYTGTEQDDPAAVLDQERQRRQDRLHRHDPQGHARHRHRRPASPGSSSPTRSRPPTRSCRCSSARASRRSSCCIHQGGIPGSRRGPTPTATPYDGNPTYDYTCGKGGTLDRPTRPILADRGEPRPGDRHGRLRPHAPALRLRRQGPQGPATRLRDLGLVVRPAVHRHRPDLRPAHPGHRARARSRARNMLGHPRRRQGRRRRPR